MWTDNPVLVPEEYIDYLACKLYGCTPSQLDEEDDARVRLHLAFQGVEERVKAERMNAAASSQGKRKGRRGI